jgi:uncharacterized protein YjbI with pentapeptide repeats
MKQQGAEVDVGGEKVGQVWRQVKPYFVGFLVFLLVVGAIWALIYLPRMQVPVCPPGKEGLPPKICFDIENEARKTLAYIMGGILAIIGIYMGFRRIRASENQVRALEQQILVAREGQITERFTRAIEQLGSERMEVRLGGIYALERIANDSDKDYWTIIETLTAYVRENASWREQSQDTNSDGCREEAVLEGPALPWQERTKPTTDVQAALNVLSRRKYAYGQGETQRLDLSRTDLRGAYLKDARLAGIILDGAHLEKAELDGAILKGGSFWAAHMEGANLQKAFLEGAVLWVAHLEKTNLTEAILEMAELNTAHMEEAVLQRAHLEKSDLSGAFLERADLSEAHLEKANLSRAHLENVLLYGAYLKRAKLKMAHLESAYLEGAHLEGTDLLRATGLTRNQLSVAILDDKTRLPDYLQE